MHVASAPSCWQHAPVLPAALGAGEHCLHNPARCSDVRACPLAGAGAAAAPLPGPPGRREPVEDDDVLPPPPPQRGEKETREERAERIRREEIR